MSKILSKYALVAVIAFPVATLVVLLSQATRADVLHLVDLVEAHNKTARIGHLYAITPDGHIRGGSPVCEREGDGETGYFRKETYTFAVRNLVGHAGPTAFAILQRLLPIQEAGAGDGAQAAQAGWATVRLDLSEQQIRAIEHRDRLVNELIDRSDACEAAIRTEWITGNCVVMIERIGYHGEELVGYSHTPMCIVPSFEDDAAYEGRSMYAPRAPAAWTTQVKLSLGLIGPM